VKYIIGENIKCPKSEEKGDRKTDELISKEILDSASLILKVNYQLLKALRSKDCVLTLEVFMKKNLNHMTFHRIFFIKKKEKLLFH
jgi:hypothetical protein